ncbi:MAG: GNAT family N-acetyltransferase [Candidatus Omnitrophota bacterium]
MAIKGSKIKLRPAVLPERRLIYAWLAKSDLTPSFMGPPDYPDSYIPTFKEFCQDYKESFFMPAGNRSGRNFIIIANNIRVGTIGYDLFDDRKLRLVLDIWMRAEKYCGKGYGTDALTTICGFLNKRYGIKNFYILPSSRNKRAIAAYRKSGFKPIKMSRNAAKKEFGVDIYDCHDNIVMRKTLEK